LDHQDGNGRAFDDAAQSLGQSCGLFRGAAGCPVCGFKIADFFLQLIHSGL